MASGLSRILLVLSIKYHPAVVRSIKYSRDWDDIRLQLHPKETAIPNENEVDNRIDNRGRTPDAIKKDVEDGYEYEFKRYRNLQGMPASPAERVTAKKVALDIKCDVCQEVLTAVLERYKKDFKYQFNEDLIMEELFNKPEEELPLLYTTDVGALNNQERYVSAHRKGCNKHFKEEVIQKGWQVAFCKGKETHCLKNSRITPDRIDVETYSMEKEAIFYACEETVSKYGEEIVTNLVEFQQLVGDMSKHQLQKAVASQCRKTAKCLDRHESLGKDKMKTKRGKNDEL